MTYRTGCCRMRCRWAGRRTGTGMRRTTSGFITRRATGRRSGRSGGARGENLGKWSFSYHWDSDSGNYVGDFHATASNVYFAGKLISDGNQVCSGANCTRAVFQDQVGTNRASGARFYPYGDEIGGFTATSNDREKFGTYVRDSFSGLDYADQRYYASAYGRFNTADPYQASAGPSDPGSWNRYAYVGGDPVNRSDPRGTCWISDNGNEIEDGTVTDIDALLGYGYHPCGSGDSSDNSYQDLPVFANDLGHCYDANSCMAFAGSTDDNISVDIGGESSEILWAIDVLGGDGVSDGGDGTSVSSGIVDCAAALAQLVATTSVVMGRVGDIERTILFGGKPDAGHVKALAQAVARLQALLAKAKKSCQFVAGLGAAIAGAEAAIEAAAPYLAVAASMFSPISSGGPAGLSPVRGPTGIMPVLGPPRFRVPYLLHR